MPEVLGGCNIGPTASTAAPGVARPPASPGAPHSITAASAGGGAHLTQALALKATFPPLGSMVGAA